MLELCVARLLIEGCLGVIYSSVALDRSQRGSEWLELAIKTLLESLLREHAPPILWQLQYYQRFQDPRSAGAWSLDPTADSRSTIPPMNNTDLAFDDGVLRDVKQVWQAITGESDGFMHFEDRETETNDDDGM